MADVMGRVPPDEGMLHFIRDADGNVEDVSDEELEATSQWYEEHFGEFSNAGRDPYYPPGWWVSLAIPGVMVVATILGLLRWWL